MHSLKKLILATIISWLTFSASMSQANVNTIDLPEIGDSAGSVVSPEFERRLGRLFMASIRYSASVNYDPEVQSYIESIGYRLASVSDNNTQRFTFFVVDSAAINAFAGPGGVIGTNSGVIISSNTESELAGVLAHEIAHVTQRHLVRNFEQFKKFSIPSAIALIGAIIIGTQNTEAGAAAITAVTGAQAQYQINFTRNNEKEADSIGMQLLTRADFDPMGMPGFFERLLSASRLYSSNAPEFLRTHPLTTNRIAESIARAESYPRKSNYENAPNYLLVKQKLIARNFEFAHDAVTHFRNEIEKQQRQGEIQDDTRYGYVIALTEKGDYLAARRQIGALLKKEPENTSYIIAAAELEYKNKNYDSANKLLSEAYKLYPDYRPVVLHYAQSLLDGKQPLKARDILISYGRSRMKGPVYYNMLKQAEGQSGNQIEAIFAQVEELYELANTKFAIEQLKRLKEKFPLNEFQEQRVEDRLAQLEYEEELDKELKL